MKSPRDDALRLLRRAEADLKALRNMSDPAEFDDQIFGFHAQQAVEKALKAWLAALAKPYPFRHDLGELLAALDNSGQDVAGCWPFVELTPYAVQLRYDDPADDELLGRAGLVAKIAELIDRVEQLVRRE